MLSIPSVSLCFNQNSILNAINFDGKCKYLVKLSYQLSNGKPIM